MGSDDGSRSSVEASFTNSRIQLLSRLEGLGHDEYFWQPVGECWSVRAGDGGFMADFVEEDELPEGQPPPLTNIAWRLWHLAVDCFGYYNGKAFGYPGTDLVEQQFVGRAEEAVQVLEATTSHFLASWIEMGDGVGEPLGPDWGLFAESNYVDLMLHAGRELIHHGAEIGLLRDLYRAQIASESTPRYAPEVGIAEPLTES